MALSGLRRWEKIAYLTILVLALVTRFYMLSERAISHDESIHTKFSWNLYAGQGFQHNPMMHGPLLFEATALSYLFLGPSDFSSRVFTSLVGVALVMTPLLFRRWLGKAGAAVTAALLLISPSISYYSRYIRHDVLLMFSAVMLLWIVLRYLETGKGLWLSWLAAAFSIMYATKEASYIYTAIFGALFFVPFAVQVLGAPWERTELDRPFLLVLIAAVVLALIFTFSFAVGQVSESNLDEAGQSRISIVALPVWGRVAAGVAFLLLFAALILIYYGIGATTMREMRLFDILMVIGTLTLPLGSAFLIKFVAGVDMGVVYEAVRTGQFGAVPTPTIVALVGVTTVTLALSVALGLWWDARRWPKIALIHYTIFIVLYTTIFTWGFGALSGLVGGLAYWLAQQGVKRGNQPAFYYFLVGPMYEYLAILFSVGAGVGVLVGGVKRLALLRRQPGRGPGRDRATAVPTLNLPHLFPLFLVGWTALSWVAYTYAGEKMPWLLVHIALPSIFLAGWGIGRVVEQLSLSPVTDRPVVALTLALPLLLAALSVFVSSAATLQDALADGPTPAGFTLVQLRPMGATLGGLLGVGVFGWFLIWAVSRLRLGRSLRLASLVVAAGLALLTVRTMVMLNYINYDLASEFLVYAHGTPDIKAALERVRDVSWAVTGTEATVQVAYGEDGSWPFTWYMVDFPNAYFYGTSPDPERLLESPVVIAGRPEYDAVEQILGDAYVYFDYLYLWWPIQDYFNLTWAGVFDALSDPAMRRALWDIVWSRDYDLYAELKNPEDPFSFQRWPYRKEFRLYVRQEIATEVWPYARPVGVARYVRPVATVVPDPYAAGARSLPLEQRVIMPGAVARGFAQAPDGTFYVADTANHRIWHVGPDGVIDAFGGFGMEPGLFSEPWDVAIDDAGNIYVADTWNHRIQKFDGDHNLITSWGGLVQVAETGNPAAAGLFYGPRALAISDEGELYVADTGNKRIQIFTLDGEFLREFGGGGSGAGRLEEPVGIDVSADGTVAVADTWNMRVQLFTRDGVPLRRWDIPTWDIGNPDMKPFLAWGPEGLYVTDPVGRRVLAFEPEGGFRWALSAEAGVSLTFPQAVGVIDGRLYVTDAHNGELVAYELP